MNKPYKRWNGQEPSSKPSEDSRRYTGIFAGILLVALGILLLLNVLNIIKFSVWNGLATYWPVGLILIGIAIMLRVRWLTVTFLILTVVLCTAFIAGNINSNYIKGSGIITSKTYDVKTFDSLNLNVPAQVYLRQGAPGSAVNVTIVGDDNILEVVDASVSQDTLTIRYADGFRFWNIWDDKTLKIYITAPDFKSIKVDGAGTIINEEPIVVDDLDIRVSGAGELDMDIIANTLTTDTSGFGDFKLKGTAKNYRVSISGAADIDAYDLSVQDARIHISGSGDVKLNVSESLDVNISGAGDISYKGDPKVTQHISGAGDIKKAD